MKTENLTIELKTLLDTFYEMILTRDQKIVEQKWTIEALQNEIEQLKAVKR